MSPFRDFLKQWQESVRRAIERIVSRSRRKPSCCELFSALGSRQLKRANYLEVAGLDLAAGKYMIIGKALLHNQQAKSTVVACNMLAPAGKHVDTSDAHLPAPSAIGVDSYATIPLHGVVELSAAGRVRVDCISVQQDDVWATVRLSALSVSALTTTP